MRFLLLPSSLLLLSSAFPALAQAPAKEDPFEALVRPSEALSPEEERTKLKVPPGFEVQLFASEPMINKPINMAFDARGRLWVTSTTEYPFPATKDRWEDPQGSRVRDSRDAIKILEDTDGDGKADKVTDFADGLNVPIGVLPYGRGCIAWSIPNIWYLEDTDGDGKCDKRTVLFGPLGYEADTHGNIASLRMGQDGWIYATHGFSNLSRFAVAPERLGNRKPGDPGTTMELRSGNTFRFRPDGSVVEQWTRGQVNPFGLCFDAWGQMYSADCHSDPITQLLRGSTYHSFGLLPGPLGFGPTMCPHRHGSTGLCGVVYLERGVWGPEWDDHMLIGNVVTSRINHDHVTFTGSTAHAHEQPDFLLPEDPWFRPVDLQIGPDHALYVADFYNKIIGHYEVDRKHPGRDRTRGRIWRIVPKNSAAPSPLTPDEQTAQEIRWKLGGKDEWEASDFESAFSLLENFNTNPRIRRTVLEQAGFRPRPGNLGRLLALVDKTPGDDPAMTSSLRVALKNHLSAPGGFAELKSLSPKLTEELMLVIRAVDSEDSAEWLLQWLQTQAPATPELPEILRAIARKLPASQQGTFVSFVRQRFSQDPAASLEFLRAISDGASVRGGVRDPQLVSWAAEVSGQLLSGIEDGREPTWTRTGNKGTSPWGTDERKCADGVDMRVLTSLPAPRGGEIEKLTGTLVSKPFPCPVTLDFWLCGHRGQPGQPAHNRNFVRIVDAVSHEEITRAYPPQADIAKQVHWDLSKTSGKSVQIELVDGDTGTAYAWLAVGRFAPAVVSVDLPSEDEKLTALSELVNSFQLTQLAPRLGHQLRRSDLRDETIQALASCVARFPGHESDIAASLPGVSAVGQQRIAELLASTVDGARLLLAGAPTKLAILPSVQQKVAALPAPELIVEFRKRAVASAKDGGLNQLIDKRAAGYEAARAAGKVSIAAGEQIFTGICAACHQIAGKGALIGPSLDGVKNRGIERLCEDILDPNRAVDPAFRVQVLTMKDQSIITGILRREEGASLVIADPAGQEKTIAKADILRREESPLSLMPAGLGDAIPEENFYNLISWLMTK